MLTKKYNFGDFVNWGIDFLKKRIVEKKKFSLAYFDIDYGIAYDITIERKLETILTRALELFGSDSDLLWHLSKDDFVFYSEKLDSNELYLHVLNEFKKVLLDTYSELEKVDPKYDTQRNLPKMGLSVAVVFYDGQSQESFENLSDRLYKLLRIAKTKKGFKCVQQKNDRIDFMFFDPF